jgi:hypothetical protein
MLSKTAWSWSHSGLRRVHATAIYEFFAQPFISLVVDAR